ncbi:hypothetical protein ABZZ80_08065 [Streptomyces sp. NPDC006356]
MFDRRIRQTAGLIRAQLRASGEFTLSAMVEELVADVLLEDLAGSARLKRCSGWS